MKICVGDISRKMPFRQTIKRINTYKIKYELLNRRKIVAFLYILKVSYLSVSFTAQLVWEYPGRMIIIFVNKTEKNVIKLTVIIRK